MPDGFCDCRLRQIEGCGDLNRAGFVAGKARVGVEGGEGEDVGGAFVDGEEEFGGVQIRGEADIDDFFCFVRIALIPFESMWAPSSCSAELVRC